jgi:hypothetical protein
LKPFDRWAYSDETSRESCLTIPITAQDWRKSA